MKGVKSLEEPECISAHLNGPYRALFIFSAGLAEVAEDAPRRSAQTIIQFKNYVGGCYLKATTGQRFLQGLKACTPCAEGYIKLRALVPSYQPTKASPHDTTRAVIIAINTLGTQLKKAA